MEKRIYQIALSLLSGVGPVKAKALVAITRVVQNWFLRRLKDRILGLIPGIGSATIVKSLNQKRMSLKSRARIVCSQKNSSWHRYLFLSG
jgi:hypothetical protein